MFICPTDEQVLSEVGQLTGTTWTLKILLVEFQDIRAHSPLYSISDFEDMFFSSGTYVSPNKYSPDGEQVFGSMRDYLSIMSDGEFTVTGYVLNDDQGDGTPEWLTLPQTKSYYDNHNWSEFVSDSWSAAISAGLNLSTSGTTKLAIIYAGHAYRGAELNPRANGIGGTFYINSELFAEGSPFRSEHPNAKFQEIGINVHEFLHLVGFYDLGENGFFDVMNAGCYCGPYSRGACPAPINPQLRYKKGWISFDPITTDVTFQADYYLRDPEVFKIAHSTDSGNYWLIETRDFTSTMTIGNTVADDYNSYIYKTLYSSYPDKGVFIWRVINNGSGTIIQADGVRWTGYPQISKGTPFPGSGNVKVLSPWSDSRTSPSWVPNTKPSTNVGMEIVDEGSDWYSLDLYAISPEDASPSKPHNIGLTWQSNHPKITWDANGEPDLDHYEVYKKRGTGNYYYRASTTNTYYVDNSELKFSRPYDKIYVYYKIIAVDEDDYESVFSDEISAVVNDYESKRTAENGDLIQRPDEYKLSTNYPNPFNPTTTIKYQLAKDSYVTLRVYNMLGEEIVELVNGLEEAGYYSLHFDGSDLPSGMYIYKIHAGDFSDVRKMLLLK